jgi:hypothetical protein
MTIFQFLLFTIEEVIKVSTLTSSNINSDSFMRGWYISH